VDKLVYADDQILMATSEDDLQRMAHHLKIKQENIKRPYLVQKQNQRQCEGTTYRW